MAIPSIEDMLQAGVHFGHQTARWNPKMRPYILGQKNGIYVINLEKTRQGLEQAQQMARSVAASGRNVLFVGTKLSSRTVIQEAAKYCGQYYVTQRWLGGMLTNFQTVRKSIKQLENIEKIEQDGLFKELSKKEVLDLNRKREKLLDVFGGIRDMKSLPGLIFVSDIKHEHIAVAEAKRLRIPVVAICDTNVNPDPIDCPIPGNDDAVKSVQIMVQVVAEAVGQKAEDGKYSSAKAETELKTEEV